MSARFTWLLSLPVVIAGCLAAHTLAYLLAVPEPGARADLLERTGHGYLAHLPVLAAAGLALLVVAATWHALRGRLGARPSPWLFALLPPLAFTVQEHLERVLVTGAFPFETALQPVFLVGLALQLPFALLAILLVRVVLGATETLARLLRPQARLRPRRRTRPLLPTALLLPGTPLDLATAPRGPPHGIAFSY